MADIFAHFKYSAQDRHNQPQSVVLEAPIRLPQDSFLPSRTTLHLDYLTVKNAQIGSDYIIVYDVYQRIGSNQYNPNTVEAGYSKEIQSIYLVKSFKYIKQ